MDQGAAQLFEIKRSAAGLGLFARKLIPKGQRIIEYTGPRVPNDKVDKSSGKYFFGVDKKWSIDGRARDNIARYINHSCRPNAEAVIEHGRVWIWARRNIQPGEEIAYHYGREYFEGVIRQIGCKCEKCLEEAAAKKSVKDNELNNPGSTTSSLAVRPD